MSQPIEFLGGAAEAPQMHFAPANGFPPRTYLPLMRHFFDDFQVVALPPRALWPAELPPQEKRDWRMVTEDLLSGIREHELRSLIAVGHSFGGVATLLAALTAPQHFRALILLDPTILLPPLLEMMREARRQGVIDQMPLVQAARRRRTQFDSLEEAFERFRSRLLFADWSDEALWCYIESNFQPAEKGVTLLWSAEWEAYYFSTVYTEIWEDLPKLKGLLPILFIRGGSSDTFLEAAEAQVREILPDAQYALIAGHGHLFPQSAPEQTAQIIRDWLKTIDNAPESRG